MKKYINIFGFLLGVGVGIGISWKHFEKQYQEKTRKEIEETKEALFEMKQKREERLNSDVNFTNKPDISEYRERVSESGYTAYSDTEVKKPVVTEDDGTKKPYVISPEEFGELRGYAQISLSYYSDDVLCEGSEIIGDPTDIVGIDFADHFGEYEADSVHIRNDRLKCDYEILRVLHPYSDEYFSKY